jgi:hypothetical protein
VILRSPKNSVFVCFVNACSEATPHMFRIQGMFQSVRSIQQDLHTFNIPREMDFADAFILMV